MGRRSVQDTDVQYFRNRLEAYGRRRQSDQQSDSGGRKKRTASPVKQSEGNQRIQEWSADVYAQSRQPEIKRPRTATGQQERIVADTTYVPYPSPPLPHEHSFNTGHGHTYEINNMQYSSSRHTEAGYGPAMVAQQQSARWAQSPLVLARDDLDMLSTAMTRDSSRMWTPPRTPAGPEFEQSDCPQSMIYEHLDEAEQNLLAALGPQPELLTPRPNSKAAPQDFDSNFSQYMDMR